MTLRFRGLCLVREAMLQAQIERRCVTLKLNPDCTRDILLALEAFIENGRVQFTFESFNDVKEILHLDEYSADEIEYHLRQCDMSGLLVGSGFPCSGGFQIIDISPQAHQFLANTRPKTIWERAKAIGKKAGVMELNSLMAVAQSLASKAIEAQLGL